MTDGFATITRDLPWLRSLAARLAGGDGDAADDLVQETLHTAWERAPPEAALHSPRGWLATVLRNRLRMTRRSDARRAVRESHGATGPVEVRTPIDELARLEVLGLVMDRLQALPELDRRIITLRFFDELDAPAIGVRLSLPSATVRSRLHRALARLRDDLDAHHGGDRRRWALLLGIPLPAPVKAGSLAGGITMTITAKLGLTIAVAAVVFAGWQAARTAPTPTTPAALTVAATIPSHTPARAGGAAPDRDPANERAWQDRHAVIRRRIGARPAPDVPAVASIAVDDDAVVAQAMAALHEAFAACTEGSERAIEGRMVVRATIIGSDDVGTIFESIEPVDPATRDTDTLECLIESSYAFVGPAPRAALDTTTTIAWLGAQPQGLADEAWRREMFDATVISHLSEVRACEVEAPGVRGVLRLAFEFADDSTPTAVRTEASEVADAVAQCVLEAARGWRFPRKFAGHTMTSALTFPIDTAVDGPERDDEGGLPPEQPR
jgi:RNA polymerase sigma-70 factor (ECF subfamily)